MSESSFDDLVDQLQQQIDTDHCNLYSKTVVKEFNNPSNVGRMTKYDARGVHSGGCGDTMEIYLKLNGDIINEITFFTDGCGATIACGSMLTKQIKGKSLDQAKKFSGDNLIFELDGLPDEHMHCAHLAVAALRKGLIELGIEIK